MPRAPNRTPATVQASCCRSPTSSCAPSSNSTCPNTAATPPASRSCRSPPRTPPRRARPWRRSSRPRASRCSAGARSRPTSRRWAHWPATRCRRSGRCSSRAPPGMDLERRAYVVRKRAEHELGTKGPGQDGPGRETVYFPSLSGQTFVYKGMLTTPQLKAFYLDLQDDRLTSALGIVHSRFSTNTFPSWPLAHPFRRIAHNGEINTVTGNENWMRAREALINTDVFGSGEDARQDRPGLHAGRVGHRALRRGARAAAPRRPQPAARRADDDPRGVGAQRVDGPGAPGVLPVPRVADGAVGRPGVDDVHRRHRDRRGAGPQRPSPVAHLGHRATVWW